ncbi:MAG: hypothetical protein ACYDE0_09140 [Acidiferrobacterales bacterium]
MHTPEPITRSILNRPERAGSAPPAARAPARRTLLCAALLCAGTALAATAQAALIAPGSSALLSGTSVALDPALSGTVLQDVLEPFTIDLGAGSAINGYIQDRVVRESGSGTLDFYYRLFNGIDSDGCTLPSGGSIGVAGRSGYSGLTTDVNYRTDSLGTVAPSGASRTADGNQVLFGFLGSPIAPGQESHFFFIKTNATAYNNLGTGTLIGFNAQGGFGQTQFSTYEPAPVPIAPALPLFASGLSALMGFAWRARGAHRA